MDENVLLQRVKKMKVQTIAEIEQELTNIKVESDPYFKRIQQDERKGVQQLIHKWQRRKEQERQLQEKFYEMNVFENKWRCQGISNLLLEWTKLAEDPLLDQLWQRLLFFLKNFYLPGIDDSKKLSEKKRNEYAEIIRKEAIAYDVAEIDAR